MSARELLFDLGPSKAKAAPRTEPLADRLVLRPVRTQVALSMESLDDRVPREHPVRAIVAIVEALDLRRLDALIDANSADGGRPAIDPRVLLSLWIYGTSQGEAFASEIARRTQTDDVYRWICGGIRVCARTLVTFRRMESTVLDGLLTQVLAALMHEKLIVLHRIAQDGTRVRASAGADSFRREPTLQNKLEEAQAQVAALKAIARDPKQSAQARAGAERGVAERVGRIERAIERVSQMAEGKDAATLNDKKKAPRASTTDPDATRMKMPDGGTRPAYNVQFATAADGSGAIVGVSVSGRGDDRGEIEPMLQQITARTGERPGEILVDGGYIKHEDIETAEDEGTSVFGPEPKKKAREGGRTANERSSLLNGFYERIESDAGKAIYRGRGEVAELSNAHAKSRFGMSLIVLRGLAGALSMALMVALTKDILVLSKLRADATTSAADSAASSRP